MKMKKKFYLKTESEIMDESPKTWNKCSWTVYWDYDLET